MFPFCEERTGCQRFLCFSPSRFPFSVLFLIQREKSFIFFEQTPLFTIKTKCLLFKSRKIPVTSAALCPDFLSFTNLEDREKGFFRAKIIANFFSLCYFLHQKAGPASAAGHRSVSQPPCATLIPRMGGPSPPCSKRFLPAPSGQGLSPLKGSCRQSFIHGLFPHTFFRSRH